MGHAGTRVDKGVRGCVACAKPVGAGRWVGNGRQICRESGLCGPETRRRGSPLEEEGSSRPRGLTRPSTGGTGALRSTGKRP